MTMAAISGTFNLCDPAPLRLIENLHRLEALAAACRWLDTRIITLCTGTRDPEDMWKSHPENLRRATWDTLVTSMREAIRIADRHEVILAFEPETNNVVNSVARARMLLDEVASPWLKVVIDPANLLRPGELPRIGEVIDEAFDWLGPDIVLAHAKNPRTKDDSDRDDPGEETPSREDPWIAFLDFLRSTSRPDWLPGDPGTPLAESPIEELGSRQRELYQLFCFYHPYFKSLSGIGHSGSIVIHGLPEERARSMTQFLEQLLRWLERNTERAS
jgi:sugar phosphate isomerase/epimerase